MNNLNSPPLSTFIVGAAATPAARLAIGACGGRYRTKWRRRLMITGGETPKNSAGNRMWLGLLIPVSRTNRLTMKTVTIVDAKDSNQPPNRRPPAHRNPVRGFTPSRFARAALVIDATNMYQKAQRTGPTIAERMISSGSSRLIDAIQTAAARVMSGADTI